MISAPTRDGIAGFFGWVAGGAGAHIGGTVVGVDLAACGTGIIFIVRMTVRIEIVSLCMRMLRALNFFRWVADGAGTHICSAVIGVDLTARGAGVIFVVRMTV